MGSQVSAPGAEAGESEDLQHLRRRCQPPLQGLAGQHYYNGRDHGEPTHA